MITEETSPYTLSPYYILQDISSFRRVILITQRSIVAHKYPIAINGAHTEQRVIHAGKFFDVELHLSPE